MKNIILMIRKIKKDLDVLSEKAEEEWMCDRLEGSKINGIIEGKVSIVNELIGDDCDITKEKLIAIGFKIFSEDDEVTEYEYKNITISECWEMSCYWVGENPVYTIEELNELL